MRGEVGVCCLPLFLDFNSRDIHSGAMVVFVTLVIVHLMES